MEGTNGQIVNEVVSTEPVRRSGSIGELAKALALSQLGFHAVKKDTVNPYFNSKYADLANVIEATQKHLATNGLVVIQMPAVDLPAQKAGVTTLLAHSSGEWIEKELLLPATMKGKDGVIKFDAQSVGSAITYARRYAYQSIIGVAAEVDDDGNAAAGLGSKQASQAVAERKIAEHKAAESKPKILQLSVIPVEGGESRLEGEGFPRLLKALDETDPHFKATFMRYDEGERLFYVKTAKAFVLVDICTSIGIHAVLAEARPVAEPFVASDDDFHPIIADTNSKLITSLSLANAKQKDKGGHDKYLKLTWDGREWTVATWFFGLFPLLTECFTSQIPVHLQVEESGKYKNVVGVVGAEKGQDGIYRFPVQR